MGNCYNSIVVNAAPERVWNTIRDFHDMSWANGPIESCEVVGDRKGDRVGARRLLNGVIKEQLLGINDHDFTFKYTITEGPSPISSGEVDGYTGEVRLLPITTDGGTFVEWTSNWSGGSGAVNEFCDPIYQALLGALKGSVEAGPGS